MRSSFENGVRRLVSRLARAVDSEGELFNPCREVLSELDRPRGAAVRRANLRAYLGTFRNAHYVLVGEAAGFHGCRFSGLPFTGEDLLVGERALPWTAGLRLARSSLGPRLSSERSAHIVWGAIGGRRDLVLWNSVPWHPHHRDRPLSNRKPRRSEVDQGLPLLEDMLRLFPRAQPVAVGRVAEASLGELGHAAIYVRHPSMGGKPRFLAGVAGLR